MTIARNHHVFFNEPTYFHLISRCVRRAFLCGKDKFSGKRYDHRKCWLKKRLFELSELFFIDLYGYAIMSNHYHLVVQTRPDELVQASDEDIAQRWCRLFPHRELTEAVRIRALCQDIGKINLYRQRLGDISWLMRCLNEGLARLANKEDGCNGRFWQGRFRSQILLDEAAVYTCMAYVDLNPVRAGIVTAPEQSQFTSIRYRIDHHALNKDIGPLNTGIGPLTLKLSDYLVLVDEAGRCLREDKSGHILDKAHPILKRLNINAEEYGHAVWRLSKMFCRGVGSSNALEQLSVRLKLKWVRGQRLARQVFG